MKGTDQFKEVIKAYLDNRAETDPLFAPTYAKPNKNIDDCITYILNTVKASGAVGFADEEIFSMAVHYYDEDAIIVGKPVTARVVVNRSIPAPAKETKPTTAKASQPAPSPAPPQPTVKKKPAQESNGQISLF